MSQTIEDWRRRKAQEDEQAYDRLCAAIESGQVRVFSDPRVLDFSGSPVHRPWDHLLPLTVLMTLALLILLLAGVVVGIIVTTLFVFAHLYGNRHYVAWRLRGRVVQALVRDYASFQGLWALGGIALVMTGGGESPCLAPKGDWRKFIRRHLGEGVPPAAAPLANAPVPVATPAPPPPPPPPPEIVMSPEPGGRWQPVEDEAVHQRPSGSCRSSPSPPARPNAPPSPRRRRRPASRRNARRRRPPIRAATPSSPTCGTGPARGWTAAPPSG